ncbi:hypothetical protein BDEG_23365 [Batrachochytrium dendrobatidis JEL423]|uniref:SKP1 component POZ domain-containing protein n=1 Tax=Batrachochytrium dendrobatidis (strain JEL423) TaxID=403673 RepID=A0A177WIC0_BATDL|nr:hypothetical protein BDEG_23365 [Batrachochytrium dendrobatidis JEL423]
MVRLFSSDNQEFSVSKEIACQSILVKNILEDLDNDQNAVIPLPNITGVVLAKELNACNAGW